ncbi:ribonuclease R [Prosthecochloris sp. ZM_2]|uniref:ribonuclease R n=1 Tax=Prosthecochloris sp. ZM_2 TaxID=2045206 RepID=UPI000DF7FF76|nr:ribonuclease R [Prosthecochloris sp. ZM_2]RNA65308.1 ribonuclease R [Prosthecochloris sp. ZM_2]
MGRKNSHQKSKNLKKKKKQGRGQAPREERVKPNDHILINEFLVRKGQTSLASEIISYLSDHEGERFRSVDLAKKMGYEESRQLPGFWYVLHKLQEEGVLDKDSKRCYGMAGQEPPTYEDVLVQSKQFPRPDKQHYSVDKTYTGIITTHPNGYGFVSVEGFDDDIFVKADNLNTAIHRDEVDVLVTKVPPTYQSQQSPHQRCEGLVTAVRQRNMTSVIGTLQRKNRKFVLLPDLKKILPEISIRIKDAAGAKTGQKVMAGDLEFMKNGSVRAVVREVLGEAGSSEVEVSAIARGYGIDETFEPDLISEVEGISDDYGPEDLEGRLDIRKKVVFTIDPVDAKDFDDALSIEKLPKGNVRIGVHIADVSHYVREGSALDREARKRSTSVYLVDRVIPMLPSRLSEEVCSLNPKVDRLAFSVFFKMNPEGDVLEHEFRKTVINSKKRFTYEDVDRILKAGKGQYHEKLSILEGISRKLRDRRLSEGGLEFETEEVRFRLGEKGEPVEVVKKERLDSHRLIEEFMLLANRKVAEYITKAFAYKDKTPYPSIYREHGSPQDEKVGILANFVRKIGYQLQLDGKSKNGAPNVTSKALQGLLKQVHGSNVEFLVNELVLRSMAKAQYTGTSEGHFGLGFEYYTHFTSPIRRYPDLIVHRLLFEYESFRKQRKKVPAKRLKEIGGVIDEVCIIANEREKSAVEAERESIKLKQVEYMSAHVDKVYPGIISGATEYGMYVRIEEFAIEGLLHMRNLNDDYYEYDANTYSLIGKRRKRRFQIGQRIKIKILKVDIQRRTIDLGLA